MIVSIVFLIQQDWNWIYIIRVSEEILRYD